jgi:hypothetical protein
VEFSVVNFSFFVKIGGGGRFATFESKFFLQNSINRFSNQMGLKSNF